MQTPTDGHAYHISSESGVIGALSPAYWDAGVAQGVVASVERGPKNGHPVAASLWVDVNGGGCSMYRFGFEGCKDVLESLPLPEILHVQPDGTPFGAEDVNLWLANDYMPVLLYQPQQLWFCPEGSPDTPEGSPDTDVWITEVEFDL